MHVIVVNLRQVQARHAHDDVVFRVHVSSLVQQLVADLAQSLDRLLREDDGAHDLVDDICEKQSHHDFRFSLHTRHACLTPWYSSAFASISSSLRRPSLVTMPQYSMKSNTSWSMSLRWNAFDTYFSRALRRRSRLFS